MPVVSSKSAITAAGLVAAGLLGLSACTTPSNLYTQMMSESQHAGGVAHVGLHYFLPRGKIRMTGAYEKPGVADTFKITTSRMIEADRTQSCLLRYRRSSFHDDEFTVEVDDNGLLKIVNSTSTDQTPAIIEAVLDTAVNTIKVAAQMGARKKARTPRPFVYTFDPLDANEQVRAKKFLDEMGISLEINGSEEIVADTKTARVMDASTASADGVLYHPPVAVRLEFAIGDADMPETRDSAVHVLPDYRVTECLSLRRAALVKQDTQLTFSSGMLQHVKFTRPSQALAAVQIPQKIVAKAADAIPAIIKIQSEAATRNVKDQTAVLQAQRDYLQAQIDLRKKEAELNTVLRQEPAQKKETSENARKSNTDSTASSPAPSLVPDEAGQIEPGATPNEQ